MKTTITINGQETRIVKETEKAICIRMSGDDVRSGDWKSFEQWIPKSVIQADTYIAGWFMKKLNETARYSHISIIPLMSK